jgi:hypothetical protein
VKREKLLQNFIYINQNEKREKKQALEQVNGFVEL